MISGVAVVEHSSPRRISTVVWTPNIPTNLQLPLMTVDDCQHWPERWYSKATSGSGKSPSRSSLDRAAEPSLASHNTSFISCPFLTPDLSRQGRLMSVLCSPQCLDARRPRSWDLHRSMELAFEGRGAGKANLAEQCCYWDYTPPSSQGRYASL